MSAINALLKPFPCRTMSVLPTPLTRLNTISEKTGAEIYCKRDDLTGFGMGGNKTRKLDFLMAEARVKGADTIVTAGANQSNFCRITAAAGAACGFDVHLVLGGAKPDKPTGNLLLDHIFGANMYHVDSKDWNKWESAAIGLEHELSAKGKNVFRLPIGGSVTTGCFGYIRAFDEILEQGRDLDIEFDTIIHATSSAGTQAGLVAAKTLTGWKGRIIGMAVAKNRHQLEHEVYELAQQTVARIKDIGIDRNDIHVDDSWIGTEYACRTESAAEAQDMFARMEGIVLDHVYSGKAAAGLLDYACKQTSKRIENILFIHTGGTVELFE